MERLTKINGKYIEYSDENYNNSIDNRTMLEKCLRKLAEYEDAEEQGLLLRLPCKIGSTLYQPIYSSINEYKVIGLCFDIHHNKWMYEVAYETGFEWHKTVCDFNYIGKTVFLTKSEAEQKLKEIESDCGNKDKCEVCIESYFKGEKQGCNKAIVYIVKNIIYPLLDEYDIGVWEDISYVYLAEKWVELVRKYAYEDNGNDLIKEDLCEWIAEQLKAGGENESKGISSSSQQNR